MKQILVIILLSLQTLCAQEITGTWAGELKIQGTSLPLVFHIQTSENGFKGTMASPKQGAKGIILSSVTFEQQNLTILVNTLSLKYEAKFTPENYFQGTFTQGGIQLPLDLKRGGDISLKRPQTPQPPYSYYTEDFTLKNLKEGNLLAGTLSGPNQGNNYPILVMITGSGMQNRDEEIMGHKPFLVIADYLAKNNIGTFRMDDRGIGGSEKGKENPTSADYATDINAAVDFLVQKGYNNIGLLGHSEGGMIAPMVKNKHVKFMVLLAGPGIPIPELMKLQTFHTSISAGLPSQQAKAASEANMKIYNFIINYKGNALENDLKAFLKQENPTLTDAQINAGAAQITSPWFLYFLKYNPKKYLSKVSVPVLALNGSLDVQVTSKENLAGIKSALKKSSKNEFVELQGLNHLFQTAQTGGVNEYGEIEETIAPQVLELIKNWVLKISTHP